MSRLKFRAWDKERKTMEPVESIWWYPGDDGIAYVELFSRTESVPIAAVVLMQSTGLMDRHGVEIYEGDIVHVKYPAGFDDTTTFWEGSIVIRRGAFGFDGERIACPAPEFSGAEPWYGWAEETWTVIGNSYQNPELLS